MKNQINSTLKTLNRAVVVVDPKNNKALNNLALANSSDKIETPFLMDITKPIRDAINYQGNTEENQKAVDKITNDMRSQLKTPGQISDDIKFCIYRGVTWAGKAISDATAYFKNLWK